MPLPTWDDVVAIAPGDAAAFTDDARMPPASRAAILAEAIACCNTTSWGARLNQGIVYLAAHLAKLGLMKGTGVVTQESIGPLSRSYLSAQGIGGSLGMTSYGAEWDRLTRLLPTALGAVF